MPKRPWINISQMSWGVASHLWQGIALELKPWLFSSVSPLFPSAGPVTMTSSTSLQCLKELLSIGHLDCRKGHGGIPEWGCLKDFSPCPLGKLRVCCNMPIPFMEFLWVSSQGSYFLSFLPPSNISPHIYHSFNPSLCDLCEFCSQINIWIDMFKLLVW